MRSKREGTSRRKYVGRTYVTRKYIYKGRRTNKVTETYVKKSRYKD